MAARFFLNPDAPRFRTSPPSREPIEFHRRLPAYRVSPLVRAPGIATRLGVGELWIKDESERFDLGSFKGLGASWAIYRALTERFGRPLPRWSDVDELAGHIASMGPLTLAAATDGNHGQAVAWMARLLGLKARVFVPAGTTDARIGAIEGEGASVTVVNGLYDDAVRRSAEEASERCLVISDTAWPGYEAVPSWVIEGYSTIFWEIENELGDAAPFDLVAVQVGVGAFAACAVRHYHRRGLDRVPRILAVEPTKAACVLASMEADSIVTLPGGQDSIMAGLNCGTPSPVAWPLVSAGIDVFVAVEDERAGEAMRVFGDSGVISGESGSAGLAGLLELAEGSAETRAALTIGPDARVLVVSTEGASDPESYRRLIGAQAELRD